MSNWISVDEDLPAYRFHCFVSHYDHVHLAAYWRPEQKWYMLDGDTVGSVKCWKAAELAMPEPPPKPVALLDIAEQAAIFLSTAAFAHATSLVVAKQIAAALREAVDGVQRGAE